MNGMKKCHYASDMLFKYFIVISFIERKLLLKRNLATILPMKSKLSRKFQPFNVIDRSREMVENS